MKLSQAIRQSIPLVREDRECYYEYDIDPHGCVIGTAMYSMGNREQLANYDCLSEYWPWTENKINHYPGWLNYTVAQSMSLRHIKGESRESIAEWVALIEPKESV